ncbi:hypothetical protein [Micromonospora sp. B006]|nr:hypothetical protein [Micromonospora sp. B006]
MAASDRLRRRYFPDLVPIMDIPHRNGDPLAPPPAERLAPPRPTTSHLAE